MIFGHPFSTYVLSQLPPIKKLTLPMSALLIGSYIPDIIDKTLNLTIGLPTRGYAHTLLIPVLFFTCLTMITRHKTQLIVKSLYIGTICHLIQDLISFNLLLWPFLGPIPNTAPKMNFLMSLKRFYIDIYNPILFIAEILSIGIWLWLIITRRGKQTNE